jgi:Mrp family chromosome partitioning ATPase
VSRFKSEPKRRRGEGQGKAPPPGDRLDDASSSDPAGAAQDVPLSPAPLGPAERSGGSAELSGPRAERAGSGRYDAFWVPGSEPVVRAPLQHPPAIQRVRHELPDDLPIDPRLVLLRDPDSTRAASFRVLRHQLVDAGSPQVIAVTSPRERERKTTCALNLALALAEPGQSQVLLVDANRLRPEVAHILRFVPPRCFLVQVEERQGEPEGGWRVVDMPSLGLHVLAIDASEERRPLVDGPAFVAAFEGLRLAGYDYIVVDTSSVLRSADVNLIQDAVDAVLLTAVQRRSTARDLQNSVEQLTPAKILGTTLFER